MQTDHSSLQWLLNFRDAENMLARWPTLLTAYSFEIVHLCCESCTDCLQADCKSTELGRIHTRHNPICMRSGYPTRPDVERFHRDLIEAVLDETNFI